MAGKNISAEARRQDPVLYLLYKNIFLILLVAILFAGIGLGIGFLRVKPKYTASKTVILRASVDNVTSTSTDAKNKNDVSLAKRLLPNVVKDITNERVEEFANEVYDGDGYISRGSVSTSYTDDSFIFVIRYSDVNASVVNAKLDALIAGFNNYLDVENSDYEVIMAQDLRLVSLQNRPPELSKTYNITFYVVIGAVIGIALSVAFVFLRYSLDNTVKDKDEFERLTDVPVLSYINKKQKGEKKKNGR